MKKIFYILLITQVTIGLNYSQSGWVLQNYENPPYTLHKVFFTNTDTGFAVGELGTFLQTTNGGLNWILKSIGTTLDLICVYFLNNETGLVMAFHGNDYKTQILKTTNGGLNWELKQTLSSRLSSFVFVNNSTGYLAGGYLCFYKTTDFGNNWIMLNYSNNGSFNDIFFLNTDTGYAAGHVYISGYESRIWKTTNGGYNWVVLANAPNLMYPYQCIVFINEYTGFAGGVNRIVKTTNGGINWSIYQDPVPYVSEIIFTNPNTGYALGNNYIYKTINCGANWNTKAYFDSLSLADIFFANENTGYAVGIYGSILKTTNGSEPIGIQPISEEIPNNFILNQNYPNPFNPSTTIKFSIPFSMGVTKLTIYDILGREVAVLVNERLSLGTYEIEWNAANFASGIYFYRLEAGNFSMTKKMVLLK